MNNNTDTTQAATEEVTPAERDRKYRRLASSGVILAVCCLALGGVFVRFSEVGPIATGGYRSLIAAPFLAAIGIGSEARTKSLLTYAAPFIGSGCGNTS